MKRAWLGILVFALVGLAGYLTYDYTPDARSKSANTAKISAGGGTTFSRPLRPGPEVGVVNKFINDPIGPGLREGRLFTNPFGGPSALGSNHDPSAIQDDLATALGGSKLNADVGSADEACRIRLRQLGIAITSGPCVDIGEIVDHLAKGSYHFNKPDSADVGEQFPLRLILQTFSNQSLTIEKSFGNLPGKVETREGNFAQSVEAMLTADDFEITPSGPIGRIATLSHPVEWEWKLKPTSAGTKTLTIEVSANIQVGPDKQRVQINTLHESIDIHVSMYQRLKSYFADLNGFVVTAAALATPLAVLIGFAPKVRKFLRSLFATLRRSWTRGRKQPLSRMR